MLYEWTVSIEAGNSHHHCYGMHTTPFTDPVFKHLALDSFREQGLWGSSYWRGNSYVLVLAPTLLSCLCTLLQK